MNSIPRTINELRDWALRHNLPLKDMRTFIGENVQFPRAFGIYYDSYTGNYVVYKNKADGTRTIRYEGKDEAFAVRELYQKMCERVTQQKSIQRKPSYTIQERQSSAAYVSTVAVLSILVMCIVAGLMTSMRLVFDNSSAGHRTGARTGYYSYNDTDYYFDGNNWYYYMGDYWEPYYGDANTWYSDDYYMEDNFYGYEFEDWYEDEYGDYYWEDDDDWDFDYDDWDNDWDDNYDWDSSYDDWDSDW